MARGLEEMMGGALSRTKGHNFEREVAKRLREAFPNALVRRSDQGFGAREADVVVEGGEAPAVVKSLWIECQCSREPTPLLKLYQAERDAFDNQACEAGERIPVVIWRKHGARRTQVTLRAGSLILRVCGSLDVIEELRSTPVTMDLEAFILILKVSK